MVLLVYSAGDCSLEPFKECAFGYDGCLQLFYEFLLDTLSEFVALAYFLVQNFPVLVVPTPAIASIAPPDPTPPCLVADDKVTPTPEEGF
jgi:hypothetical protein